MRIAKNKNTFVIIVLLTLLIGYIAAFGFKHLGGEFKGAEGMRLGIDIKGGVDVAFKPKVPEGQDPNTWKPTDKEMEAARTVIETRLDAQGVVDRTVTVDTAGYVLVQFPWKADETEFDPGKAIEELGNMAHLTFRDPEGAIVLEGSQVASASAAMNNQKIPVSYYVKLELKEDGRQAFADATARLIGQKISIYMDEEEIDAPTVNSAITEGSCVIEGLPSFDYARTLASQINSGALPFALYAETYNAISPELGANALDIMLLAGLIAFLLISLGLVAYYRVSGVIAIVSLILQIGGLILILSLLHITVTLAGIAGIILSVGMGVDANIINAERIRDELRSGKNVDAAVSSGFERAFTAIFDGNITPAIAAVIMLFLGSGALLSFAYTLLIGLVMNFVGGVTATRLMTQSLTQFAPFRKTTMFLSDKFLKKELKVRPYCRWKKYAFLITGVLLAAGVAVTVIGGVRLDINFTGGSIVKYTMTESANINTDEAAGVAAAALNGRPMTAQITEDFMNKERSLVFTVSSGNQSISNEDEKTLNKQLQEKYPDQLAKNADGNVVPSDVKNVEPLFGRRFLQNGLIGLLLALLAIILYVWIRFRKIEGLPAGAVAMLCLLHDLAFVFLTFTVFGFPIGDTFLAAALTTLGTSLNNTIVVYDRIRENKSRNSKADPEELADISVSQTLTRCINVSAAVLISMLSVYILAAGNGLDSIISLALPLAVVTIAGCFASIFYAAPIWARWEKGRSQRRLEMPKKK